MAKIQETKAKVMEALNALEDEDVLEMVLSNVADSTWDEVICELTEETELTPEGEKAAIVKTIVDAMFEDTDVYETQ